MNENISSCLSFGSPYFVCKKINLKQITPYFQEVGGVTQHVFFNLGKRCFEDIKFSAI